jgi:hypothetical protein
MFAESFRVGTLADRLEGAVSPTRPLVGAQAS